MNNLKTELLAQLEQELPSLIALKGYGQKKILEFLDESIDKSYKQGMVDVIKDARQIMKDESPDNPHAGRHQEKVLTSKYLKDDIK